MVRATETIAHPNGDAEMLGHIAEALARLRFGQIQLTVHDGKVMQIDVTERKRLNP